MFVEILYVVHGSEHVRRQHLIDLCSVVSINVRTRNPKYPSLPPQIIFNFGDGHSEKFEGLKEQDMEQIIANWKKVKLYALDDTRQLLLVPNLIFTAGWIDG